jgi:tRNA(Ile)-lysidine synthase
MKKVNKLQDINHLLTIPEPVLYTFLKKTVIVGVSGGADSLCLLHILHRKEINIIAVYVNHGLREEAESDGLHVQSICEAWQIPFRMVSIDVQEFSQVAKLSIEEASRILRYRKLFEIAISEQAAAVAVAHHADDQVETVLMHILRGAGMNGLRGMPQISVEHEWHSTIPIIRPLLSIWKQEIEDYCEMLEIEPVLDASNLDTTFFRNRLRHELIPDLETYNPNFKQSLLRMSRIMQDDYDVLDNFADDSMTLLQVKPLETQVTYLRDPFLELHISLQRMVLRKIIFYFLPDLRDVDFAAIERAIHQILSCDAGKQIDIVDDLVLFVDGAMVVIKQKGARYQRDDIPLMHHSQKKSVEIGKDIPLGMNWFVKIETTTQLPQGYDNNSDMYSVYMDADQCGKEFFIKTKTAGDRFAPCGLDGHTQKVSDIFTNMKASRWVRDLIPLFCDDQDILWIPGHRIAEKCKITKQSSSYYRISFFQK